ncbi:AMP-binding protein [Streptococcus pseudoporcinus]|uniref:Bacitracin synthetase n=1 Tax=Streptococcus pseudoporcinus TaxID=361101 RepID=A0A4U9XVN4_9STRE|nr:AMP-binding protein [Streptococcus pseudoporcinus]VTS16925.1 bacitracin synthetase [Streptococcus pseudoporcinus]VUC68128.1 bacitracin synthetase [Streptococcus pseudoporcinus]VUC99007.1 bacitracin synthetase [Streptococcus pseudoporcinus]VUC99399.1 bacitracin synthetase [Streptococcus pseudoporcinus]
MKHLIEYLHDITGIDTISGNSLIIEDLRLSSKQVVDLSIYIKNTYNVNIPFYDDITVENLIEQISYDLEKKKSNIADYLIYERNIKNGNELNTAIQSSTKKITYGELWSTISNDDESLFNQPTENSRCLLLMEDSVTLVILYWALLKRRVCPGILNNKYLAEELEEIIDIGKYQTVIISPKFKNMLSKMIFHKLNSLEKVLVVYDNLNYEVLFEKELLVVSNFPEKDSNQVILYSSGSTGIPKGILHDYSDILYTCQTYGRQVLKLKSYDIVYSMSNLSYGFSLTTSIFQASYSGATMIVGEADRTIWKIISDINKYSPTVICGVPKLFKLLLDATQLKEFDISNTRLLLSAGELLPVSVWQEWYMKYKKPIIEGYGSVEMMTNVISNTLDDYTPGSAGKLLDGYKGTIKKNGELVVEGDSISNKILGNIENYLKCYSTKDIFEIDSENKYWFKGRIDYIQKYNGIWLNPLEIEKIILEFNCFDDVLLIVDDLKLYCFIASELPKEKTIHKLKNIFRENFTTNIFPTNVILVKEIPRNNNGKKVRKFIDRGLWKEG